MIDIDKLVAFDLETTGIDPFTDIPVSWTLGGMSGFSDPGIPIPSQASAIHGITNADVIGSPSTKETVWHLLDLIIQEWDYGHTIIGMNVSYDLTMLNTLVDNWFTEGRSVVGPVLDILIIDRKYDKWRKGSRTLSSLCRHYGVELENAHSSTADANACVDVFKMMVKKWPNLLKLSTHNNEIMQFWYQEWAMGYNDYLRNNLRGNEVITKGRMNWPIHTQEK